VLRDGLREITEGPAREVLERDILPKYIAQRRWYSGKDSAIDRVELLAHTASSDDPEFLFNDVKVTCGDTSAVYNLPLAIAWDDTPNSPFEGPLALARVRRRARVGLLTDGFASVKFVQTVLDGLAGQKILPFGGGSLVFRTTSEFDITLPSDGEADWPAPDQSNSSVVIGRKAIVKLFRRCVTGIHPEAEMIRFLTERGFSGVAALLGEVTRVDSDGAESLMAIAQRFVANQGDGFRWTVNQLERVRDEQGLASNPEAKHFELYENFAHRLGVRLGQMHRLLAQPCDNPDFTPETADAASIAAWRQQARRQIEHAFETLSRARPSGALSPERQTAVLHAADEALGFAEGLSKTRVHGDLHLGQVLVAAGDIIFIDFEGEPLKSLAERRAKMSPLRDVAGMLRSFDYAARIVERSSQNLEGRTGADLARALTSEFRKLATAQFLLGYAEGRRAPLAARELKLITVFALEKAAYEVVYEATYRPDWLDVPVKGFAILADEILRNRA